MERVPVSYCIRVKEGTIPCWYVLIILSTAGKSAMSEGCSAFNKTASELYRNLDSKERDRLKNLCSEGEKNERLMTEKEIQKMGARIFKKIQSEVCVNFGINLN